ncbi:EH domain-binding protein 1, partial [Geodia barretti]
MSAQKAFAGVRRLGKEAYQFQFTSEFEYIALECKGTWRPTLLKVVWFRNHRKVESIPVKWVTSEDRGPNGASGKAKFKPSFSVGLVVTLYKGKGRDRFEEKEYKYYVQDQSEKGNKVLASFTIDLKEYTSPLDMNARDALEMTFHNESHKVDRVVMGMTLSSQLLKRGKG